MNVAETQINAFVEQLQAAEIKNGDFLLVHSKMGMENMSLVLPCFLALQKAVGPQGTVAFPTFTFDFCEGKTFDYEKTPSQMGLLSEFARRSELSSRIFHPIYGFALVGAEAVSLSQKIKNISSYGDDSLFGEIRHRNGKILTINLAPENCMTFFHHVEEMVSCSYRYMKSFSGKIIDLNKIEKPATYTMFVRDLEKKVITDVAPMCRKLEGEGLIRSSKLGPWALRVMNAGEIFEATKEIPNSNPDLLRKIQI